jgi:hypothetical protein
MYVPCMHVHARGGMSHLDPKGLRRVFAHAVHLARFESMSISPTVLVPVLWGSCTNSQRNTLHKLGNLGLAGRAAITNRALAC